jgi:hypothetical protein
LAAATGLEPATFPRHARDARGYISGKSDVLGIVSSIRSSGNIPLVDNRQHGRESAVFVFIDSEDGKGSYFKRNGVYGLVGVCP